MAKFEVITKEEFKKLTGVEFSEELVYKNSDEDVNDVFYEADMHSFKISNREFYYDFYRKEITNIIV